jgi:hypothetical protein
MAERKGSGKIAVRYGFGRFAVERKVMDLPDGMAHIHYGARPERAKNPEPSSVLPAKKLTRLDLRKVGKNGESKVTMEGRITAGTVLEIPLSPEGRGRKKVRRGKEIAVYAGNLAGTVKDHVVADRSTLTSRHALPPENGHSNGGVATAQDRVKWAPLPDGDQKASM